MKKYILIIPLLGFLFSCNTGVETPENLLPKEKMITVLIDFHLREAAVQGASMNAEDEKIVKGHAIDKVLAKHGVDSASFTTSYDYYLKQVEQLNEIYDTVLDSIETRVGDNKNLKQPTK